ncbi:hypothetical protein BC943DRAFT_317762, partial [Umbelopsis sp. AD052]
MYFSFPAKTLLVVLAFVALGTCQEDEMPQVVAARLINERMGVDQGYNLNLRHPEKFGYIHSAYTPFVRMPPDQEIRQGEAFGSRLPYVPSMALAVLSEFKYYGPTQPIQFKGRVSPKTVQCYPRLKPEYPITIKFSTFDYDHAASQWFQHTLSGPEYPGIKEITGTIRSVRIIGRDLELVIDPLQELVQYISVADTVKFGSLEYGWGPASSFACTQCTNATSDCRCQSFDKPAVILQKQRL